MLRRSPNNHNWQSVADRISELEKQQQKSTTHDHSKQQQYTYLDPSKTHRVPNPALKAFQKNAIQSYFERQQQQQLSMRLSKSNQHLRSSSNDIVQLRHDDTASPLKTSSKLDTSVPPSVTDTSKSSGTGAAAMRPLSLNLSVAIAASSSSSSCSPSATTNGLVTSPSATSVMSTSSTPPVSHSQRSSWSNASPTTPNQSLTVDAMMKNANDIAKMNMKNSAISSAAAAAAGMKLNEKQLLTGKNGKSQSINKSLFTAFCEIKTEHHPTNMNGPLTDSNSANKTNSTPPPPLPRKSILRR